MTYIIKIAAAAILFMAALANVSALAQEPDVTDQQAAAQLDRLSEHFIGRQQLVAQTNASSAVTPSLEFRITSGRQYTVAYPKFVAGYTGDQFEYRVLNNDACSVINPFTGQALTWNGTPQGFTVPAVVNGLIGGNFVLKCTNSSAMVFAHIYNVGMIAVVEGRVLVGPAGVDSRTFDGVSSVPNPRCSWLAAGGNPAQGFSDFNGTFFTTFSGPGWHIVEAAFGPDLSGSVYRTRTAFYAQGTGNLVVETNRVGGYSITAVNGATDQGSFTVKLGGWSGPTWSCEIPGLVEGGQVQIIPPPMFRRRPATVSYTSYETPGVVWQQVIDPR